MGNKRRVKEEVILRTRTTEEFELRREMVGGVGTSWGRLLL